MEYRLLLQNCTGFQWDHGNETKNWDKHCVSKGECEQIFFNKPLIVKSDKKHSIFESRYYALGSTNRNRLLFVVFTVRQEKIRVISARDMTDYEEVSTMKKNIPQFKNEFEERSFWQQNDSKDYIDWSEAEEVALPKLKPSTKTISLRLPESMLEELKILANKRDIPYQSLLKIFLSERIHLEQRR